MLILLSYKYDWFSHHLITPQFLKSIGVLTSICKCRVRKVGSVTLYLHYSSVIATLFSELTSGTPFINVIWFGCLLRNSCVCLTYTAAVCLCITMPMLGNFLPPCCFKVTIEFWCKIDSIILFIFSYQFTNIPQNQNTNSWRLIWNGFCFKMITLH